MVDDPQELVLDLLRKIRSDISEIKDNIRDLKAGQISIRDQIHNVQGDALRRERVIASLSVDVDRIKSRLDLVEH